MKYYEILLESPCEMVGKVENIMNESDSSIKKVYTLEGIFSTPNLRNRNGRIYSTELWEKNVLNYQKEIENNTINTFGEWEHPPRTSIDKSKAVIKINELKMVNGVVVGKATVVDNDNNPYVKRIKKAIDLGEKIGVSSRGVGSVSESGIVEEFHLITYDVVELPSDYNAMLNGVYENFIVNKGIVEGKIVTIENGCIGDECLISENVDDINQNINENVEISKELKELKELKEDIVKTVLEKVNEEINANNHLISQYIDKVLLESNTKINENKIETKHNKSTKTIDYEKELKKLIENLE